MLNQTGCRIGRWFLGCAPPQSPITPLPCFNLYFCWEKFIWGHLTNCCNLERSRGYTCFSQRGSAGAQRCSTLPRCRLQRCLAEAPLAAEWRTLFKSNKFPEFCRGAAPSFRLCVLCEICNELKRRNVFFFFKSSFTWSVTEAARSFAVAVRSPGHRSFRHVIREHGEIETAWFSKKKEENPPQWVFIAAGGQ